MGVSLIILYLGLYAVKITVAQTENIQDQLSMCEFYDGIILREGHFQSGNINEELSWFACNNQITGGYCPRGSRMCLQESSTSQPFPLDLGETLTDVPKELSYTTRLVHSKGFVKCKQDPMKNYTIYVSLDESAAKAYLRRCGDDRCAFELRIPDPGRSGELPCTKRVEDGGAVDLVLDFRKLIDDFIVEGSDGMRRVFNLCRLATGCNDPSVSSCSYTSASSTAGNSKSVWGDLTTRLITYENGAVQFQFRSGSKKSGGLTTKVDVHCNWTVMQDVNPIYLSKTSSQRISKFVIQSSLGCVKLPMNCKFFGDDYNEYEYDLSDLYRPNGNVWNVENDRHTSIRMNICGPLRSTIEECQKTHSQICGEILFDKQQRQQQQLSYGSILVDKKTDGGDILTARLVHGSVCPKYSNTTLTTNLKWKCSYKEKGPKLISIGDCSIDILWETPKACPASVITVSSLNIYDHLGHRNLTGLCVGDRSSSVMPPSSLPTAYFTYNFCKPLGKKCNGMSNVSVCLYLNRNEKILGYYKNTKLSSRNGILSMEFTGDGCLKTNISFHCDYSAPASGIVQIFQTDDDACTYRISVKSPSVCATRLNSDGGGSGSKVCIIKSGNSIYNLTALTKYDENYRILNDNSGDDDDETRRKNEFHFNICNPLITGPSSMCKPNSAICLHNTSEPNFRNRFFTIGNYPGVLNLTNDQVHIEFINGDMCSNRQFASAKITFVCVTDRHEDTPVLVKSDGCRYEFVWKTNYSCPKIVENHISYTNSSPSSSCVIPYGNEKFLNLTSIEHKRFQIYHNEERANLTFDVCNMNYTKSYANGRKEMYYFDRIVTDKDMEYNLARQINCKRMTSENSSWNILKMKFDCRYNEEDVFKIKKINNCTAYIQCNSVLFCKEVETRKAATVTEEKLENAIAVVLEKIQNVTLNKHVDVKQANETQETVKKNEEKSTVKDQSTSNLRRRQQPKQSNTIYKDVIVCIIKIGTKEIYLNKLSPVTIQSRSGNRYTIGNTARANGRPEDANRCNDYVCKGGTTIATLNTCPNVTVTDGDGDETRTPEIQLTFHYTSQQQQLRGQAQPFVTTIFLKCNSTAEKSEVKDEKDTSLTLSYPIGDVCLPPAPSSKPAALIITGCVILIVIFFAIITFYLYKRRTYLRLRKSDKSDLYLYARDAQA